MKKINSLQTLRLVGAISVFQYHLWNNYLNVGFEDPGTDVFLVLAGVVAAIADKRYIASGQWGKYMGGRYLRLYVTFLPVFLIYVLFGRDTLTAEYVLKSFFVIPLYNRLPLVGPMWMVALFLVFYWLFSIAIIFRREWVLIPVFGLWGIGCMLNAWFEPKPDFHPEWFYMIFDVRTLSMIFGYVAGKIILSQRIPLKAGYWLVGVGLVALAGGIVRINSIDLSLHGEYRPMSYGIPLTLIALGLATLEQKECRGWLFRAFVHQGLVWLGGASYVIFLIHNVIIRAWDTVTPISVIHVPLIITVVLAAAALIYRYWEMPVLAYLQHKFWGSSEKVQNVSSAS